MQWIVIYANKEQQDKIYTKYFKPKFGFIKPYVITGISKNDEDKIYFISGFTVRGKGDKSFSFQMRNDEPCFMEFYTSNTHRYDLLCKTRQDDYMNQEIYDIMKKEGLKMVEKFEKGGMI